MPKRVFALTASPKQLILLQSDGIRPTMALTIKASAYLWSKSRALLLTEHAIVSQILHKTKTSNLHSSLISYSRHFTAGVYSALKLDAL